MEDFGMFYHPSDYKFIYSSCEKWVFVKCTAKFSHVNADGQPVFKDCKGNFAILRKNNWTKFDEKSLVRFMRGYFDSDEEFETWKMLFEQK